MNVAVPVSGKWQPAIPVSLLWQVFVLSLLYSESASREIAKSLSMLFGGIDLDATDRFFAVLLLAEHQGEMRQRNLRAALAQAGRIVLGCHDLGS